MSRAFADITFTPAVRTVQAAAGTRTLYAQAESRAAATHDTLVEPVAEFMREADSFFIATVGSAQGEAGWPYVQHRGGEPGLLRVLDEHRFAFDDVAGNGQLVTVGNLADNDRVMIIVVDYEQARRLKLWGHARVAQLSPPGTPYRQQRRTITVTLSAWDFNCSAHIPHLVHADRA